MRYNKLVYALLLIFTLNSCGFTNRMYMNEERKVAIAPAGHSSKSYQKINHQKKKAIKKRNSNRFVAIIIGVNALIFIPLLMGEKESNTK